MRRTLSFLSPLLWLFAMMWLVGLWTVTVWMTQKAHDMLSQQEHQVYALVMNDLVSKLERETRVQSVWQPSKRAQSIINHHFSQLAPIKRISVFDIQGRVLLDTNPLFAGSRVPDLWLTNSANPSQRVWQDATPGMRAADAILRNQAGEPVAYLVVLTEELAERDMASKLIFSVRSETVLFLLLVLATLLWLGVRLSRRISQQVQPVLDDLAYCAHPQSLQLAPGGVAPTSMVATFTKPLSAWLEYVPTAQKKLQKTVDGA